VSKYPSIPTPQADPQSLMATVIALKQVVDQLTGSVGPNGPTMRLYTSPPSDPTNGDAWLRLSDRALLLWNASSNSWVAVN